MEGMKMASKTCARVCLAGCLILALSQASAHHSVAGQFDRTKRVSLTGVVTKVDWINPHTYLHLTVIDGSGNATTWQLESLPTAMLRKAGITSEMLMGDGATVTVDAIRARDGTENLGWLLRIDYPDGHYYQLAGE
jgi:hypothetical protein